jgi:hypothetical protein
MEILGVDLGSETNSGSVLDCICCKPTGNMRELEVDVCVE